MRGLIALSFLALAPLAANEQDWDCACECEYDYEETGNCGCKDCKCTPDNHCGCKGKPSPRRGCKGDSCPANQDDYDNEDEREESNRRRYRSNQ